MLLLFVAQQSTPVPSIAAIVPLFWSPLIRVLSGHVSHLNGNSLKRKWKRNLNLFALFKRANRDNAGLTRQCSPPTVCYIFLPVDTALVIIMDYKNVWRNALAFDVTPLGFTYYMLAVSSTQVARTLCEELVEIDAHWRVFSARYCERKGVWVCVWVLPRGVWKGVERKDHPLFWFRTWASWHIRTWTRAELVYLWMRSKIFNILTWD